MFGNKFHKLLLSFWTAGSICLLLSCSGMQISNNGVPAPKEGKTVRVLLLKTSGAVVLSSSDGVNLRYVDSDLPVFSVSEGAAVKSKVKVSPADINSSVYAEALKGPIAINGITYRGRLLLYKETEKLVVVNAVSMSDYLKGVVPSEVPASWPGEVLKAQAVAARTFCLYQVKQNAGRLYDLDATTGSQVYKGAGAETAPTSAAVDETAGVIITESKEPIAAFFHSTCGGKTADAKNVWQGGDLSYLASVDCGYCTESKYYSWETVLTLDYMAQVLRKKYSQITKITGLSFLKKEGRVIQVKITSGDNVLRLAGNEFRMLISPVVLRSLYFTAAKEEQGLRITGHGWGHGVGMCQWGARGMAAAGKDYKDILNKYYKGVKLVAYDTGETESPKQNYASAASKTAGAQLKKIADKAVKAFIKTSLQN